MTFINPAISDHQTSKTEPEIFQIWFSLLVLVVFYTSLSQGTDRCAKIDSVSGNSCGDIVVKVDLSKCNGSASQLVKIDTCENNFFTGSVIADNQVITISGKGTSWGGKTSWQEEDLKISYSSSRTEKAISKSSDSGPSVSKSRIEDDESKTENTVSMAEEKGYLTLPKMEGDGAFLVAESTGASSVQTKPSADKATAPIPSTEKKNDFSYLFSGDIRQRYESLFVQDPGAGKSDKYDQLRLRARLGVVAQPASNTLVEFRLATGSGGTATNQTYGETIKGFRNYDFKLDRAYGKLSPFEFGYLTVGRMANPFSTVGDNDMVFDADLNFDGTAIGLEYKSDKLKGYMRVGQFVLEESKDSQTNSDVKMGSIQVGGAWSSASGITVGAIASQHQFGGVKDHAALVTSDFGGNSNASSKYSNNYNVSSYGISLAYDWKFPITVYYDSVKNAEVSDENTAAIYGLKIGKLKAAGDWSLSADSREVRKDATLGIFTDGQSYGGGTNGRNLRIRGAYNFSKFISITISRFTGQKNIGSGDTPSPRDRLQADLNIKF